MPLQTQSTSLLSAAGQENVMMMQQRSTKTVSFQTPGAAAAGSKKSKTTGRRAFGDISNRKQQQQQQSKQQQQQQQTDVIKPPQQQSTSIRLERKPSTTKTTSVATTTTTVPKAVQSTTKSTQKQKRQEEVYEPIEIAYGPTGKELDELYDDSSDHVSVCSMEKEGFVFTRHDTMALLRQGLVERRKEEDEFLQSNLKTMDDEYAALARQEEEFVMASLHIDTTTTDSRGNDSLIGAMNDLSMALSDDDNEHDEYDWGIPL